MTIPDYQTIMLPLLRLAGDQQEHSIRQAYEQVAAAFSLTDEERRELLPSRGQPIIENRVGWAKTYLAKAGLFESARRGHYRITDLGLQVLSQDPQRIDVSFLRQFPSFVEFQATRKDGTAAQAAIEEVAPSQTPRELLEYGYERIQSELSQEVLTSVRQCSPIFFERLVVELLLKMGYGGSRADAGEAIGRSGDGGIDGIIKEDKLGLDVIYVQAKRWEGNVSEPAIRDFVGALVGRNADKGVFITTSDFTKDARSYTKNVPHSVILIDGHMLANLMIANGVGVTTEETYEVKRLDLDYFTEE